MPRRASQVRQQPFFDEHQDALDRQERTFDDKVARFLRFVLTKRGAIRRDELVLKIQFEKNEFQSIFEAVQKQLREIFAMQLVDFKPKAQAAQSSSARQSSQQQQQQQTNAAPGELAVKVPTEVAPGNYNAQSWILVSTLDAKFQELILPDDNDDQMAQDGALFLILLLIFANGGSVADSSLFKQLHRFGFSTNIQGHKIHDQFGKFDQSCMEKWTKMGYLTKQKVQSVNTNAMNDNASIEWSWGPRAKAEVDLNAINKFMTQLYGEDYKKKRIDRNIDALNV
ncbi:hypothetical protein MP228_004241 [Amoeboaphelidium protococcarum]|nr:hypothetical protein MP228_004241 [Amoeboaphelidium protococcarum]